MNVTESCIQLIKHYEGLEELGDDGLIYPYKDAVGYATIGWGNRFYEDGRQVTLADNPITRDEAESLLRKKVQEVANQVSQLLTKEVTLSQFDALVSFAYNLGWVNLKKSTLLKKVNNGASTESIVLEFGRWVYAGGKILKGLVKRRKSEAVLYSKGILNFKN